VRRRFGWLTVVVGGVLMSLITATPAQAQLNTQHVKGSAGQKAGSQPPPHLYVVAPLWYVYTADQVKTQNGDRLPTNGSLNSQLFAGGLALVTTKKILGGFYEFQVLFPAGANNRIQGTEIDQNPGAGLTDTALQPISLGWHFKRADAVAGYMIYIPTGRYTNGANDNTGLGMWGQEFQVGTTVYLTENKQYHAGTLMTFNTQSKKEDSETKVGNQVNFEGGVGGDFLKGGLTVGLDYYWSVKVSDDQIQGFPNVGIIGRNKAFALGPEVQLALAKNNTVYGFLKVAHEWEVYARTAPQGRELTLALTLLVKPLKLPTKP
jgi:hypothetical protein